ncbi:MAG: hypothetical protein KC668_15210, partial [Myxococcales bacterium]|nr:hypothetical protein [Myxococcales bacterium]
RFGDVRVVLTSTEAEQPGDKFEISPEQRRALVGPPSEPLSDGPGLSALAEELQRAYRIPRRDFERIWAMDCGGRSYDECTSRAPRLIGALVFEEPSGRFSHGVPLGHPLGGSIDDIDEVYEMSAEVHRLPSGQDVLVLVWSDSDDTASNRCWCNSESRTAHVVVLDHRGHVLARGAIGYEFSECGSASSDTFQVGWQDLHGDGRPELVGTVSFAPRNDDEAWDELEEEDAEEGADADAALVQTWFVHDFDAPAPTAPSCRPPASPTAVDEPRAPRPGPARARAPARLGARARRALHRVGALCDACGRPATCLEFARSLHAVGRHEWARTAERAGIAEALSEGESLDALLDVLRLEAWTGEARASLRASLVQACEVESPACVAVALLDLMAGTSDVAAVSVLLSACELTPAFRACGALAQREDAVGVRARRVLCTALDASACIGAAADAARAQRPLTTLEQVHVGARGHPVCPE